MNASVILCVRNGAGTIAAQLAALAAQECSQDWELVVVDNGCTDDTVDIVREWSDRLPGLRVVQARERAGLAYARNAGARAAAGQVLVFCDADDIAHSGWLEALLAGAESADMVGGRLELELLNDERARYWRGFSDEELWRPVSLGYLPYAVGANFAVRRQAFDAVGGCDETFLVCDDDVDLSWRIQQQGGTIGFREDAVMHYRLRSDLRGLVRQQYVYGRTEALLKQKFGDQMPPYRWREQWPLYRHVLTRSWHLLADGGRRGNWLSKAAYVAGRLAGAVSYRVVHF
jgi:glycosyltransferase involved in cell wall biosynthesis